jgi:cytosine/uracil/thiamine/allantoin permease
VKVSKLGQKRSAANREWVIWTVGCIIDVLGLVKAGFGGHHVFWLMVWPVPVTIACTIFIFVRQGFHFKDGLLVLGRRD